MGIRVALNHRTHYRYERPVVLGPQWVRLRPAPYSRTPILSYSLGIKPKNYRLLWQQDAHSNHVARVLVYDKTDEFTVDVEVVAELSVVNPFDFFVEPGAEEFPFDYPTELRQDLLPYLAAEPAGPWLQAFLNETPREKRGTVSFL